MEAAIRLSQNSPPGSDHQRFLHVNVSGKSFRICEITEVKHKRIKYDVVQSSTKVPAFRAFDWHPVNESLIAVGQSGGEATLLNIADGYQDSISFSVRSQRLCNAVNLSSQNLIAVGLDKVRTDFCLNIWDFNQKLPTGDAKAFSKQYVDPLHKLAGGEPITSLKFFDREPQLLLAGVKSQFVKLFDLREPQSSNSLQFSTKCVHNLTIDNLDDYYFASCYPSNEPLVCLWDRRMISRNHATPVNFNAPAVSDSRQPEVSVELKRPIDDIGTIWSLRFSKARKRCLGVMSSMGHLRAFEFEKEFVAEDSRPHKSQPKPPWYEIEPPDVFLKDARDVVQSMTPTSSAQDHKQRVVSFDFTSNSSKFGEPKVIVMTGEGELRLTELNPAPEPASFSSTGYLCRGSFFQPAPILDQSSDSLARSLDRIRRLAEPRNALRQAFKQAKQSKSATGSQQTDIRRMSSFADHCWNTDLGFFEKGVALEDLLKLTSASRLRCEAGYQLNAAKNKTITADSRWLGAFWSWVERAERISRNKGMVQDNIDLSYIGVFGVWMEEIATKPRLLGSNTAPLTGVIRNLANRLNLPVKRLCPSEFRSHRQLSLYVSDVAWGPEELEMLVKKLISRNQHTKAAAIALFASDEKLAYQSLRSKTSAQTHKMLAMALAGSKNRRKATTSGSATEESSTEGEDDWTETIASLSSDLTDPYARAILAYVKSGDWVDVLEIDALPLKHRIGIAVRHLDDNDLTAYIGRITRQVVDNGDIEGVILTGTGTTEGLGLLSSYARHFTDLQTAALSLSVGGAADRFIASSNERDAKAKRTIEAFRETYRMQMMQWGLKFDRVRFDVGSSKALSQSPQHILSRPKEQIRLVCTFCSGSITQFPNNGGPSTVSTSGNGSQGSSGSRISDTHKNVPTPEKAAVTGTVCPICGRHLPRCGVCDFWLGTPDETYAKWSLAQQSGKPPNGPESRSSKRGSADLSASIVTTVGPISASTATIRDEGQAGGAERQRADEQKTADENWYNVMHKFTVFCVTCGHGFHAAHARLWFEGRHGRDGHRVCPVPGCECRCNG